MFCFSFSSTSLSRPYLDKDTAAARAALPIPASVCSIFVCSDNDMAANVWVFLCVQTMTWLPLFEEL